LRSLLACEFLIRDVALVDPNFDTDATERRTSFEKPVVNVRAQRVQRYSTLTVELAAAHFCAAETTGALDTNTLSTRPAGGLYSFTHRTAERHACCKLFGDTLCH